MGRPNYIKLTSLQDVGRFMAKLINQRRNKEIGTTEYRDLFYGLKGLKDVLEAMFLQSEVLERLARLEGETYIPPSITQSNGSDEDAEDLDEPGEEPEDGETWA